MGSVHAGPPGWSLGASPTLPRGDLFCSLCPSPGLQVHPRCCPQVENASPRRPHHMAITCRSHALQTPIHPQGPWKTGPAGCGFSSAENLGPSWVGLGVMDPGPAGLQAWPRHVESAGPCCLGLSGGSSADGTTGPHEL